MKVIQDETAKEKFKDSIEANLLMNECEAADGKTGTFARGRFALKVPIKARKLVELDVTSLSDRTPNSEFFLQVTWQPKTPSEYKPTHHKCCNVFLLYFSFFYVLCQVNLPLMLCVKIACLSKVLLCQ